MVLVPRPRTVIAFNALVHAPYDAVVPSNYTADHQPQIVLYKQGGAGGTTVATLTITYSGGAAGGDVVSVERT